MLNSLKPLMILLVVGLATVGVASYVYQKVSQDYRPEVPPDLQQLDKMKNKINDLKKSLKEGEKSDKDFEKNQK